MIPRSLAGPELLSFPYYYAFPAFPVLSYAASGGGVVCSLPALGVCSQENHRLVRVYGGNRLCWQRKRDPREPHMESLLESATIQIPEKEALEVDLALSLLTTHLQEGGDPIGAAEVRSLQKRVRDCYATDGMQTREAS